MNEFQIKLVKWGLVFFTEPAVLKTDTSKLEINKNDGSNMLSSLYTELKKANFNSINGMWTLVSTNGQKCNIIIKDDQASSQLKSNLEIAGVKGINI